MLTKLQPWVSYGKLSEQLLFFSVVVIFHGHRLFKYFLQTLKKTDFQQYSFCRCLQTEATQKRKIKMAPTQSNLHLGYFAHIVPTGTQSQPSLLKLLHQCHHDQLGQNSQLRDLPFRALLLTINCYESPFHYKCFCHLASP